MSAAALLAAMLAAMHAQHSVHYVSTSTAKTTKVTIVADVGRTQGTQRITFMSRGKTGHVTVVVANGTAYFRGDAFTLHGFMGIPSASAQRYAGDWVRVAHNEREYASVAADVTLPSVQLGLVMTGAVQKVKGGIRDVAQGRTVTVLLGKGRLPTRQTGTGGGSTFVTAFSRWNESVHVAVPSKTVPVAKLRQTAPGA
jgi:hypothetical protein